MITKQVYKKELEVKQKVRLSLYQGRRSFNQGLYTLDDQYIHQEYQNYNIWNIYLQKYVDSLLGHLCDH